MYMYFLLIFFKISRNFFMHNIKDKLNFKKSDIQNTNTKLLVTANKHLLLECDFWKIAHHKK